MRRWKVTETLACHGADGEENGETVDISYHTGATDVGAVAGVAALIESANDPDRFTPRVIRITIEAISDEV